MNLIQRLTGALSVLRGKAPKLPGYVSYLPNYLFGDYKRVAATPHNLVQLYRDTAYSCANLNARGIAKVPLRLYVKTATGQRKSRLASKAVEPGALTRLRAKAYIRDENVEEVTEHPILELLDKPCMQDGIPLFGRFSFLETTQLYLEVVGRAYWLIERGAMGTPSGLWILPSQFVEPHREATSAKVVDEYRYFGGSTLATYKPDQVVPFTVPSLADPYTGGMSPLAAAMERCGLLEKHLGLASSFLSNRGRPDAVLSPKDPMGVISDPNRKRLEELFAQKYRDGGAGSVFVSSDPVDLEPLNFAGKDIAELTEQEQTISVIARCFDVPLSMLHKDANRASAAEGRAQHANDALAPRCARRDDVLNARLVSLYDDSGRLFLCSDDPVPVDPDMTSQIHERYGKAQVLTPNEIRREIGYPDIKGGDDVVKPPEKPAPGEEGKPKPKPSAGGKAIEGFGPKELAEYASASAALRAGEPIRGLQWR